MSKNSLILCPNCNKFIDAKIPLVFMNRDQELVECSECGNMFRMEFKIKKINADWARPVQGEDKL